MKKVKSKTGKPVGISNGDDMLVIKGNPVNVDDTLFKRIMKEAGDYVEEAE